MQSKNSAISNISHFEDIGFHLKNELRKAKHSVKICVAWISWSDYNQVFNDLARKGVKVEILYNDDYLNKRNFISHDYEVRLYPVRARFGSLMHNKFCIIDNKIIITGSFNWSRKAYSHFENIVIIKNDFKLAKSFLHEFEDLKNYFYDYSQQKKILCGSFEDTNCRSSSFNLGILGAESGLYEESLVDIWNVCLRHAHITFLGEQHEQHLHSYLWLKIEEWDNFNESYDMEAMLDDFQNERNQIKSIQNYLEDRNGYSIKIHAIGFIKLENPNEHIEWGEDPQYIVDIVWRDMYYRKSIPDIMYNGFYDIDCIVRRHH